MKIQQLLIVPQTHHDVGYTHVPEAALNMQIQAVARSIELCEKSLADETSGFCWTCETSYPVIRFLESASRDEVCRFQELVHAQRIAVTGGFMHMTQLIGAEEYVRFFEPVGILRDRYGLPVSVVQHGDVNGLSWGSVQLMSQAGIDTLVMTLNPDHGRSPFEQPTAFYWEGPDGSRVLVWLNITYSFGHLSCKLHTGTSKDAGKPISELLQRLEQRDDYPFDFAVIHSGMDNRLADDACCEAVREWNAQGNFPPMRIVTIDTAMALAHQQAKDANLPTYRGEWADYWAHGHGSSAFEVTAARSARGQLRTAETARSLCVVQSKIETARKPPLASLSHWYGDEGFPSGTHWQEHIDKAYEQLLLFEEHTWGSNESVDRPHTLFAQAHWNQKAAFAYNAAYLAHELEREAIADLVYSLPASEDLSLVVVNPLGTKRDAWVTVNKPPQLGQQEERTLFEEEETIKRLVRDIPPFGVKAIPIEASPVPQEQMVERQATIQTPYYTAIIDAASGSITHLYDKKLKRQWVDESALTGIGGVVYEEADPDDPHPTRTKNRFHFRPESPGPRFLHTPATGTQPLSIKSMDGMTTVTAVTNMPYLPRIETTFTFRDDKPDVDVAVVLDKVDNFEMESVHVLFPFLINKPEFLLDTANATYHADIEQLPDTCRDWYSIQSGMVVTDQRASMLWATREAPLVQLGGFQTGKWQRQLNPQQGHIHAWLMNNLYFTNFKGSQGGRMSFHFSFAPSLGRASASQLLPWAQTFCVPVSGRVAPVKHGDYQWLNINSDNVVVQYLKPAKNEPDTLVLRLKETAGLSCDAIISWQTKLPAKFYLYDFLESINIQELSGKDSCIFVPIEAHGLTTVKIVIEHERIIGD